jgi:altronate hydrolase
VTSNPVIRLHANDNVLIARGDLTLGQHLPDLDLRVRAQVPPATRLPRARLRAASRYASTTP